MPKTWMHATLVLLLVGCAPPAGAQDPAPDLPEIHIIATGSPFKAVEFNGKTYPVAQCNNSYIFPGIGLGVLACKARLISDEMLRAASKTLADASPRANSGKGGLLPPFTELSALSKQIAFNVAKVAIQQGLALEIDDDLLQQKIEDNFWTPQYRQYKRVSA